MDMFIVIIVIVNFVDILMNSWSVNDYWASYDFGYGIGR